MAKEKKRGISSCDLVIVPKNEFPILEEYPIDEIGDLYERIEKLASWFVLRAPLSEVTRLANPSCISMFESSATPDKGSRSKNRVAFDDFFLCPLGLDCTKFEFVYKRTQVKTAAESLELNSNTSMVFSEQSERAVVFVGKDDDGKEDSCIESICRHVRNSFAHGRIAINDNEGDPLIFLEDGTDPSKVQYQGEKPAGKQIEVRMRMLVRLDTLESWYERLTSLTNEIREQ